MNLRLRSDLQVTKRDGNSLPVWVVKDPVSFSHYLFSDQEYQLATLLAQCQSVEDLIAKWQQQFQSKMLTRVQVQNFVNRLVADNLVVVDQTGFGKSLISGQAAGTPNPTGGWKRALMNPLAIRFRGINPTPILRELDWMGWVLFHPVVIFGLMFGSLITLLYMLGNFETVVERLPTINEYFSQQGLLGFVITIAVVKMLHELGHALACRRYGGECFEIGVMLLVLVPTLFTNVSDAWTIRERWKRMMVSFAGMYVEIVLAALAAIAWFATPVGFLNSMLFNIALLCSVNTILLNGNPLLRYDGYYLLSDWLEQANLSQHARSELDGWMSGWFIKPESRRETNGWLLAYGIASWGYRWFVVGMICYGILTLADQWNATAIGRGVCVGLLLSMVLVPLINRLRNLKKTYLEGNQSMSHSFDWLRTSASGLVMLAIIAFVIVLPMPKSVYCEFEVTCQSEVPVFSPSNGQVVELVSMNQTVQAGEMIGRVVNHELEQIASEKRVEIRRIEKQIEQMKARLNEAPEMVSRISTAEKSLESLISEVSRIGEEQQRLTLVAPCDGVVVRKRSDNSQSTKDFHRVDNRNCFVKRSDRLISLGNTIDLQAIMHVSERSMGLVEPGQKVRLKFDRVPSEVFAGEVTKAIVDSNDARSAFGPGELGELEKTVRVSVRLESFPESAVVGSVGRARIEVHPQTVAQRINRAVFR